MGKGKMALKHASEPLSRRTDYEDRTVFAFDFGHTADPSIDIVGDTAIIVTKDDHHEIDLPGDSVEAFNRNGIVTIEVDQ